VTLLRLDGKRVIRHLLHAGMTLFETHTAVLTRTWTLPIVATTAVGLVSCVRDAGPPDHFHYSISAAIDPARQSIEASVDLTFRSPSADLQVATFLLHREMDVTAVTGVDVSDYEFDPAAESAVPWIPAGGRLVVSFTEPLGDGETTTIHFEYGGIIDTWPPWSANVLTEEWTELGLYFPWFPYNHTDYGPFTFAVDAEIDPAYEVRGFGEAELTETGWHLEQGRVVNDIVLFAARDIRTTRVDSAGYVVHVHFTSLDDSVAAQLAGDAVSVLGTYSNWFGGATSKELSLVETKRELGGGYARPGLIVLSRLTERTTPEHRAELLRYLAHEAAHFWWTLAPADSWEDWLNESFAEYSALLVLRDAFGEAEFRDRLAQKERESEGGPSIWNFDRSDTSTEEKAAEVQAVLYSAGPVLLDRLAARISHDRYLGWCRELVRMEVHSTEQALDLLRLLEGNETAGWLEQQLRL
jgi:hypothetical protein